MTEAYMHAGRKQVPPLSNLSCFQAGSMARGIHQTDMLMALYIFDISRGGCLVIGFYLFLKNKKLVIR